MNSEKHYHIRWSTFDWKAFQTSGEATELAVRIKKPNEIYVIEECDKACEICKAFKSNADATVSTQSRASARAS